MEYTITGKSPDMLEEKLASYKKLAVQRAQLQARLEKTEAEKDSVSGKIYEKVKVEYEGKLENLRAQLDPIESEVHAFKRDGEKELADLVEQIRLLEEELAEAEFRHRVGEYPAGKMSNIRDRINPDLKDKSERKTEILDQLRSIRLTEEAIREQSERTDQPVDAGPAATEPKEEAQARERAADRGEDRGGKAPSSRQTIRQEDPLEALTDKPAKKNKKEDVSRPAPADDLKNDASFENPQSWINEIGDERLAKSSENAAPAAPVETEIGKEEEEDPLSALADPSDERAGAAAPSDAPPDGPEEVCVGFPNLVMITGHASGKKIPLLPMTMSVGREHDNNIELKDPEVGRYHARILYERGRFVLEDLESSNGTWVNGERITQAPLKNGDRIKIGDTEMVIDFD